MAVNGQNLLSSALDLPKSMWKRLRNKRSNMTSKDYRDFAVEQMGLLEGICTKPMMGEFLLYWQGKYFGGIYDNRVLVKKTKTNERFGMPEAIPYEGAKAMYQVNIDNREVSGGGHQGYLRGTEIDRCTKKLLTESLTIILLTNIQEYVGDRYKGTGVRWCG